MLQIASGKYLRVVPWHVTYHQRVLYTNVDFLHRPRIALTVGTLYPSTDTDQINTVAVRLTERLEAVDHDGKGAFLIATGGDALLDDLAIVLSFALNATFSSNHDLVRRLIPAGLGPPVKSSPAYILRRTCDHQLVVVDQDIDDLEQFVRQLLALNRPNYIRAMRAMRQVVNACRRVADDPTLSYTMMVAALEALAPRDGGADLPWDALDQRKRDILDPVLAGLDSQVRAELQQAILKAEKAGARRRFIAFVLDQVSSSYYREDATEAVRPLSSFELRKALVRAYNIRSSNVHELQDLRPEAWAFGDSAESVDPAGQGLTLTLEGLNRLSRHVIREFIARASTQDEEAFDYRSALPGVLRVQLAPQFWVSSAEGLSKDSAGRYFAGVVDVVLDAVRSARSRTESSSMPMAHTIDADLRAVCLRIEALAPGLVGAPRRAMIAIYYLWNRLIVDDKRMPNAQTFIERYGGELEAPSIQTFVVACVLGEEPPWSTAEFEQVVEDSVVHRSDANANPLPSLFRAALAAETAERIAVDGRRADAIEMMAIAVEELPGNSVLLEAESRFNAGHPLSVDLDLLIFGSDQQRQ